MQTSSAIASIVFGLVGMIIGAIGIYQAHKSYSHNESRETRADSQGEGTLKSDVSYIKRRVDDVLLEQKETNKTLNEHSERLTRVEESTKDVPGLSERVTRVEESAKQAHKRLDGLERRVNGEED